MQQVAAHLPTGRTSMEAVACRDTRLAERLAKGRTRLATIWSVFIGGFRSDFRSYCCLYKSCRNVYTNTNAQMSNNTKAPALQPQTDGVIPAGAEEEDVPWYEEWYFLDEDEEEEEEEQLRWEIEAWMCCRGIQNLGT